jgi:hypothetical protein
MKKRVLRWKNVFGDGKTCLEKTCLEKGVCVNDVEIIKE